MSNQNIYDGNNPYQELKCIWMASNIVEYKLCDRNFDCENCPFDKVMRNLSEGAIGSTEKQSLLDDIDLLNGIYEKIKDEAYNEKLIYLKNQIILKNLFSNTYYMGFNQSVLTLLDNITSVETRKDFKYILKNQLLFKIKGQWGKIAFTAPINLLILEKMNLTPSLITGNQWFAIISANPKDVEEAKISYEEWKSEHLKIVKALSEYKIESPSIGQTMRDGGIKVKYLFQLIGIEEYSKLLKQIFNQ